MKAFFSCVIHGMQKGIKPRINNSFSFQIVCTKHAHFLLQGPSLYVRVIVSYVVMFHPIFCAKVHCSEDMSSWSDFCPHFTMNLIYISNHIGYSPCRVWAQNHQHRGLDLTLFYLRSFSNWTSEGFRNRYICQSYIVDISNRTWEDKRLW
jgi:hypothetical protein